MVKSTRWAKWSFISSIFFWMASRVSLALSLSKRVMRFMRISISFRMSSVHTSRMKSFLNGSSRRSMCATASSCERLSSNSLSL